RRYDLLLSRLFLLRGDGAGRSIASRRTGPARARPLDRFGGDVGDLLERQAGPALRLGRRPLVAAFGELLDHLADEGRQVVGIAARDETVVDDDLFVDPLRAGI